MSDRATTEYLREVLLLDPSTRAGELLERRRSWRNVDADGPGTLTREEVEEQLEQLADQLLEEDPRGRMATLAALDLERFPDLVRRRERLLRVAEVRDELDAARGDRRLDKALVNDLSIILTSDPRRAAERRRKALLRLEGGRVRRAAIRTVRWLEKEYPGLARLEAEFLGQVRRARRELKDRRRPATIGFGCFGVYVLIQIVRLVIGALTD